MAHGQLSLLCVQRPARHPLPLNMGAELGEQ
jgi:hypothetical protein